MPPVFLAVVAVAGDVGAFWELPSAGDSLRPRVVVLRNVACNSRVNISNIEIVSLELQRCEVLQKVRAPELHATDG